MIVPLRDEADPSPMHPAENFYAESLRRLVGTGLPFLLAGTYAVAAHTGIRRPTKDLDVFCKAGDCPRIAASFQEFGYEAEIEDERWIAKLRRGRHFFDVIFNSSAGIMPIADSWFADARTAMVYGVEVRILAPTELIWSKCFVQNRERFDGADVAHVILHYAPIAATVEGEPKEIFPFLGSSRLGDTIDRFKVGLALHGHAHHGSYAGRTAKGVPVYNCAATVEKDGGRPYALLKV